MWTHVLLMKACIMYLSATTLNFYSIWEIMWNVIFFEKNWAVILLFRIRGLFCIFALGKNSRKTQNAQVRERLLLYLTSPGHDFFFWLVTRVTFLPSPPAAPTALTRRPLSLSRLILSSSEDANPIPENLGSAFLRLRDAFAESSEDDLQ